MSLSIASITESARRYREMMLSIHESNINGAQTRRQAFARFYSYTRWTPDAQYKAHLESVLISKLHRLDAANGGSK
jgi:hypothetical protein